MKPVLSILIITHNQRDLLKRCFLSVIAQELNVPFEIIISDDRSTDGTDLLVTEFKSSFEGVKRNLIQIKYVRCNSDDCNPYTVSDRCGWNKLNAWRHVSGKYMVNVDADDYLRSEDIYQLQIDLLEEHPECSMCMQRTISLKDGDGYEYGVVWPIHPELKSGKVLSSSFMISEGIRGLNQSFMIRFREQDDMETLYGKSYDDTVITYHHLQYGPVVFLDRADYVWIQYPKSISHNLTPDDDVILHGLLPLYHARLFPSFKHLFLRQGLPDLIHMFKFASAYPVLSNQYREDWSHREGFIYRYYTEPKHSLPSIIRYLFCRGLLLVMKRFDLESVKWLDLAETLLVV